MITLRKIALFGGTFDPVHLGHLYLAELAKQALDLDEIRFLPCRISPHKMQTHPASGEARYEMLRIATTSLPWAVVDDFELRQSLPSYSYQTAEAMSARFPDTRLYWIMGGDQWDALPYWQHPQRLANRVEFIVLARGVSPSPREGYRLHILKGEHLASATEIRKIVSEGKIPDLWLHPQVAKYIANQKLYQP